MVTPTIYLLEQPKSHPKNESNEKPKSKVKVNIQKHPEESTAHKTIANNEQTMINEDILQYRQLKSTSNEPSNNEEVSIERTPEIAKTQRYLNISPISYSGNTNFVNSSTRRNKSIKTYLSKDGLKLPSIHEIQHQNVLSHRNLQED